MRFVLELFRQPRKILPHLDDIFVALHPVVEKRELVDDFLLRPVDCFRHGDGIGPFERGINAVGRRFATGSAHAGILLVTDIHSLFMPLLRQLPPETAHRAALLALARGLGPRDRKPDAPVLATSVWELDFRNPVGLAAGFDKGAEVPDQMLAAGFGFVEAGTVTPLPQPGNPRPRLFRLPSDRAVINRLGFNGDGLPPYVARISRRDRGTGPLGANIGRNRHGRITRPASRRWLRMSTSS